MEGHEDIAWLQSAQQFRSCGKSMRTHTRGAACGEQKKKRFSPDAGAVKGLLRSHGHLADVSHWGAHWDAHGASREPGLCRVRCAALPPGPSCVVPAARSTRSADACS